MKNKHYISRDYPKACRVCEVGKPSFDGSAVLCEKKGIMDLDDCCRHFVYDPLKRIPKPVASVKNDFSPEDFAL